MLCSCVPVARRPRPKQMQQMVEFMTNVISLLNFPWMSHFRPDIGKSCEVSNWISRMSENLLFPRALL